MAVAQPLDTVPPVELTLEDISKEFVLVYSPRTLGSPFSAKTVRLLPQTVDDLTSTLRFDLYEEMLKDAKVKACHEMLVMGILGGGFHVRPALSSDDSGYKRASKIADECQAMLTDLDNPLGTSVLPDMLKAVMVGHRIAEQVYYPFGEGPIPDRWCLKKLKVLPRKSLYFQVDDAGNVVGFVQRRAGTMNWEEQVLPREKFAVLTWKPTDNDPRGTSSGQAAYLPWWYKTQLLTVLMQYASQFGIPSIMLELPGNVVKKGLSGGSTEADTFAQTMLQKLQQFQNSTGMTVPAGTKPHVIEPKSNGEFFIEVFKMLDDWIEEAVLFKSGGSGKDAVINQELMGLSFDHGKTAVENMIRNDILKNYVRFNYGPKERIPKVHLPGVKLYDVLALSSAFAKLQSVGMLHPDQFNSIFSDLGLPLLSDAALEQHGKLFQTKVDTAEAALDALENPPTVEGENNGAGTGKGKTEQGKQTNL